MLARNKERAAADLARSRGVVVCCICKNRRTHKKAIGKIHIEDGKVISRAQAFKKVFIRSHYGKHGRRHAVGAGYACPKCHDERVSKMGKAAV